MTNKDEQIDAIQELLREEKGLPVLDYLMKLSSTELTWLTMSLCAAKDRDRKIIIEGGR